MIEWLSELIQVGLDFLKQNQFASGGLVMGLGAVLYRHGGSVLRKVRSLISRHVFVTINLDRFDYGFEWIRSWLKDQLEQQHKLIYRYEIDAQVRNSKSDIELKQSDGRWFIRPGFRILAQMHRVEEKTDFGTRIYNKMSLTTARWNKRKLIELMSVVGKKYGRKPAGKIYLPNKDGADWEAWCDVPHTKLEHVILPSDLKAEILRDLEEFVQSEDRYRELGLAYKRGYLLFGPPGNGKTSLIRALAHHLGKSIAFVTSSQLAGSTGSVRNLISKSGSDKLIVVEDIDRSAIVRSDDNNGADKDRETNDLVKASLGEALQAILNLLDGVQGGNGQIIITTANHPEKLDKAFLRPGRIDRKFELGNATREQIEELFVKFFGEDQREPGRAFSEMIPNGAISMARIQQHFIEFANNQSAVLSNINKLFVNEITGYATHSFPIESC